MYAELLDILMSDNRRDRVFQIRVLKTLDQIQTEQEAQREILDKILTALTLPPAAKVELFAIFGGEAKTGEHITMKVAMNTQGSVVAVLKTSTGMAAIVDGIPTWTPDVEGVVALQVSSDGLSVQVQTLPLTEGEAIKTVTITFEADADLGEGVQALMGTLALTVYDPGQQATIVELTPSEFTPIPTPTP